VTLDVAFDALALARGLHAATTGSLEEILSY
jgi:hypothetical protein